MEDALKSFEDAWQRGLNPRIEDWLTDCDSDTRPSLLRELLGIELWWRKQLGQHPRLEEYLVRFHDSKNEILAAFTEFNARSANTDARGTLTDALEVKGEPDESSHRHPINSLGCNKEPEAMVASEKTARKAPLAMKSTRSTVIGPYQLLQKLGEGGMGEVWMAQQEKPVRRRVALKLIKAGMDSKQILVRFEAERQALAMMDHPNIAKILDVGTTADDRPFFVMELISGQPLTRYCDENKVGIVERLKLFLDVCAGVQHAHQKGIIHRDLKPGNILVGMQDGQPVPKIIDFGLAKAMESTQRLTDQSLFTGIGQILGTLKYMSPEQASLDNLDIDTRADIYALGVILYELMTGATPLDESTIKSMAALQILNVIRDQEPVRPSSKLSSSTDAELSAVLGNRRTDATRLKQILSRDLDWIVIKALEKDRTRRYESASGFAADIRRYLNNEPVVARPPSLGYRARKFVRKHQAGVVAALLVGLSLAGGMIGTTLGLVWALKAEAVSAQRFNEANDARKREEEQRKLAEKRSTEAEEAQHEAEQERSHAEQERSHAEQAAKMEELARLEEKRQRDFAEAINKFVIEDFLALTSVEGQVRFGGEGLDRKTTLGQLLERAAEKLRKRTGLDPLIEAKLSWIIGVNYRGQGDAKSGIDFLERSFEIRREKLGPDDPDTLSSMNSLAVAYSEYGDPHKAVLLHEQTLELEKAKFGLEHPIALHSMSNLASAYIAAGDPQKAVRLHEQTLELMNVELGPEHSVTLWAMSNLAAAYRGVGELEKAILLHEQALELQETNLGLEHAHTLLSMSKLALAYSDAGDSQKALLLLEKSFELRKATLGPEHPATLSNMDSLGMIYGDAGQMDKSMLFLEQTLELRKAKLGPEHLETITSMTNLASAYANAGDTNKALPILEQALELRRTKLGLRHPVTLSSMDSLGTAYRIANQLDKAIPILEQALELMKAKLGPEHPETLKCMISLGQAYSAARDSDRALPLLLQTLDFANATLGAAHPYTLACRTELATAYSAAGDHAKALLLHEQTLELMKAKLGADHPNTLTCMNNLANEYGAAGDPRKALPLLEQTLELRKLKLGLEHPQTLRCMSNLGAALAGVGNVREALSIQQQTLELMKAKLGPEHLDTVASMHNLGVAYKLSGAFDKALPLLEQALEIRKAKLGPQHLATIYTMNELARSYWLARQLERSIPMFEELSQIVVKEFGRKHLITQTVIASLGVNYKDAGRNDEAIPLLEEAHNSSNQWPELLWTSAPLAEAYLNAKDLEKLTAIEQERLAQARKQHPAGSLALASVLVTIADQYLIAKAPADAEPLLREGFDIRSKLTPDAWSTYNAQAMLGASLLDQQKYTEAEPLLLDGYNGLKEREAALPPQAAFHLSQTLDRLIELYTILEKPEEVAKYQALQKK